MAKVDRARDKSAWMAVDKKDRNRASEIKREREKKREGRGQMKRTTERCRN